VISKNLGVFPTKLARLVNFILGKDLYNYFLKSEVFCPKNEFLFENNHWTPL
jgi:hypothetical protein